MCAKSLQSCPTLCNTMAYSPLGSSVHGILQARILEWVAIPSSRGSSWPRHVSCGSWTAGRVFTAEPSRKPQCRAYLERNRILMESSPSPICFLSSCILYEGRKHRNDETKQGEEKWIFHMLSISVLSSMFVHLSDLITLYMRTVVLEKTLESPLDCKIKPVNPKGNQPWIFIGRTDAKAESPILWPPDVKKRLIGKDPDAGKD